MRKLSILTATMGSVLVLISPVAFSGPVVIDAVSNSCTFLDTNGEQVKVSVPDQIKVVQRGNNPPQATCKEASLATDGGQPVFFEGTAYSINSCAIYDGSGFTAADYQEKIDKKGTTLTCTGVEPPPPT